MASDDCTCPMCSTDNGPNCYDLGDYSMGSYSRPLQFDGTIKTTSGDDVIGYLLQGQNSLIYGHRLQFNHNSISCVSCDIEYEIPEIIQGTAGFRQVLYKLYLMEIFRSKMCEHNRGEHGTLKSHWPNNGEPDASPPPIPGHIHYQGSADSLRITGPANKTYDTRKS